MLSVAIVACLFLPASAAFADAAPPPYTMTAGAGVFVGDYGIGSIEVGGGKRTTGRTIWYVRADVGRPSGEDSGPIDGLALEVRTGPVWRHCMISGCHGLSLELGVQRVCATYYRDALSSPPPLMEGEYELLTYHVVGDIRWRGELYVYRDGLVSLEFNVGIRLAPGVFASSKDTTMGDRFGILGGGVAGLALIVRH